MAKRRIDQLLTDRKLCESREKAQRAIMAGIVRANGQVVRKASETFSDDVELVIEGAEPFVSRGGLKLEAALNHFQVDVTGLTVLDVGASTGGFTDCLLQRGAARVISVDVGHGQLHWKLRQDPRVVVLENLNARYLKREHLMGTEPNMAVVDVSFISLTKVLPAIDAVLKPEAILVALIKPQFEAGPEQVGSGGVVQDPEVRQAVVSRIDGFVKEMPGWTVEGVISSPILGPAGNEEFLIVAKK